MKKAIWISAESRLLPNVGMMEEGKEFQADNKVVDSLVAQGYAELSKSSKVKTVKLKTSTTVEDSVTKGDE